MRSLGVSELRAPRISTFAMASGIVSSFWTAGTMAVLDGGALFGARRFDGFLEFFREIRVWRFGIADLLSVTKTLTVHYAAFEVLAATFGMDSLARETRTDERLEVMPERRLRLQEGIGYLLADSAVAVDGTGSELHLQQLLLVGESYRLDRG